MASLETLKRGSFQMENSARKTIDLALDDSLKMGLAKFCKDFFTFAIKVC